MDYIVGIFFIACPSFFNLEHETPQGIIFYAAGAAALIYSLLTQYELGFIKIIPIRIHLLLDLFSGLILAASPWLFNFAQAVYVPHLAFGLIEIAVAFLTQRQTAQEINA